MISSEGRPVGGGCVVAVWREGKGVSKGIR